MQARAINKRRRRGKDTKPLPPPQSLQAEAKAEASKSRGQQPQPPQPPLGKGQKPLSSQDQPPQPLGYVDKAARRRAKRLRRKARRLGIPRKDIDTPEPDANSVISTLKRPVEEVECDQIKVNTLIKRLRKDSPSGTDIIQYEQDKYDSDKECSHNSIKGVLTIKEGSDSLRWAFTPSSPIPHSIPTPSALAYKKALREQRSKLHRKNCKAKRDFSLTLEALSEVTDSDTDSEYTPKSLADSTPTSGQSASEPVIEIPSDTELFGLRAKPVSPVPETPSTSNSSPKPVTLEALWHVDGSSGSSSSESSLSLSPSLPIKEEPDSDYIDGRDQDLGFSKPSRQYRQAQRHRQLSTMEGTVRGRTEALEPMALRSQRPRASSRRSNSHCRKTRSMGTGSR